MKKITVTLNDVAYMKQFKDILREIVKEHYAFLTPNEAKMMEVANIAFDKFSAQFEKRKITRKESAQILATFNKPPNQKGIGGCVTCIRNKGAGGCDEMADCIINFGGNWQPKEEAK